MIHIDSKPSVNGEPAWCEGIMLFVFNFGIQHSYVYYKKGMSLLFWISSKSSWNPIFNVGYRSF